MSNKVSYLKLKRLSYVSVITIIGSAVILTTFQNCGKAGFEATGQENLALQQQEIQSDVTPFAFEAAIDQISYLSCANANSSGKAFTFKVGAYGVRPPLTPATPDQVMSGVRITKAFVDWAKVNVRPNYDPANPNNTIPTATDAKVYLASSKKNEKAQVQLSMRKVRDLTAVYPRPKTTATYGIDIVPLMGMLTDDRWLSKLVDASYGTSDPAFINFFPLAGADQRLMEGSLNFNTDEGWASSYRSEFDSNAMLTLGYDDNIEQTLLRTPAPGSKTRAYGLGYKLTFSQDLDYYTTAIYPSPQVPVPHPWNTKNIMTKVTEVNLETGAVSGRTWSCAVERRYSIVRKEDQPIHCPKDNFVRMTDANYKKEYEILRRHFPAKDYDVSVDGRCIVPLNYKCYQDATVASGTTGSICYGASCMPRVEYDLTQPCFYASSETSYPNPAPTPYCAEIASICVRN